MAKIIDNIKIKEAKIKLDELKKKIHDNELLKEIEIPVVKTAFVSQKSHLEKNSSSKYSHNGSINAGISPDFSVGVKLSQSSIKKQENSQLNEAEQNFSSIFLQVFQIKELIQDLKKILESIGIRHIVILLDDFSEIDNSAIKIFVDVILAPLNNWSDEFVKFKVAAYPNRVYYGKIDLGKVDIINLDFYNLYSEFERNKMEEGAIDFTKRLIEKRFNYFIGKDPDYFFDTTKYEIQDYYELLFHVSMNVPRIIGYILSYCYERQTIKNKLISKSDIEAAAHRYYEEKIEPFFHKTTYSLITLEEKVDNLQLKELLNRFIERMVENKKKISTLVFSGETYISNTPYTSHFHIVKDLEEFLNTLELNFFLSKYIEMSDKDGKPSSIYCLNYGLTQKHKLLWGKPKGSKHRKYFIERPFSFNSLLKEFLSSCKRIHCINPECNQTFTQEQIPFLEFLEYKCNKCASDVIIDSIPDDIKAYLDKIDESTLLPPAEMEIIMELSRATADVYAKDIAEELDMSSKSIAHRCKMLDLKKELIVRNKNITPYKYKLSEKAKDIYQKK